LATPASRLQQTPSLQAILTHRGLGPPQGAVRAAKEFKRATLMAIPHAYPGMPVDLRPDGESLSEARSGALVKDESFEAIRLVIPKGHEMSRHQVDGAITIYCLDGRIAFTAGGKT